MTASPDLYRALDHILPLVEKPSRYTGCEINAVIKDPAQVSVRMVLSYPDVYEVGMSNIAVRILYDAVNRVERFACERVFAPWPDFEKALRGHNLPLYSLETRTPLRDFDLVGFSIGYEMLCTNMLCILETGGIPLLSRDRDAGPLVIAGGPGVLNPEPIADFVDVFMLGEADHALVEVLERYENLKGRSRQEILRELNRLDYIYIPSLYAVRESGRYLVPVMDTKVTRRIEPDLNDMPVPDRPLVPLTSIVQERVSVEVSRGCVNGCRYCQAGYTYRPVRERSVPRILDIVERNLEHTGYDKVSLSSLSIGDFTRLEELVQELNRAFSSRYVSISLPSIRVNSASVDILRMIGSVRRSGLTFAVESPDSDMRDALNKPVGEESLNRIVSHVMIEGWRLVKLYFMIGLPELREKQGSVRTEGGGGSPVMDEARRIVEFIHRLRHTHRGLSVNVNVSVFIPKPHTPLEREPQVDAVVAEQALAEVQSGFRGSKVRVRFQNPRMSMVEGVISRGDRRVGELIRYAYGRGERFSSWDDMFRYDLWAEGMEKCAVDPGLYLRQNGSRQYDGQESGPAERLPWHYVDCGVSGRFLERELARARERTITENCLTGACSGCGVCDDVVRTRKAEETVRNASAPERVKTPISPFGQDSTGKQPQLSPSAVQHALNERHRLLFGFRKQGSVRFISHLDLMNTMLRVGRMAGIPFRYTEGHNPKPRFSLPFAIPLGVESEAELAEVVLSAAVEPAALVEMYNELLPPGLHLWGARYRSGKRSIAADSWCHDYLIQGPTEELREILAGTLSTGALDSKSPGAYFEPVETGVLVRLDEKLSLKKLFRDTERDFLTYRIVRTALWRVEGERLVPFLEAE